MTTAVLGQQATIKSPTEGRRPLIASSVLGTLVFVGAELMFFTGLISAYLVIKAGVNSWVPPANVRLPVAATAFNTVMLALSGLSLFMAGRKMKEGAEAQTKGYFAVALLLGSFFVAFQGKEWLTLVSYGMTVNSGLFGACFFLLIGSHGFHALGAVLAMAWFYFKLLRKSLSYDAILGMQVFWFFVVGIWPVLYGLVYF